MKQSDKLKVLIDSIKTANDMMRKQIEINGRAVELLGEFITEPEQVEPETIKPEDMKAGEWYVNFSKYNPTFLFKFKALEFDDEDIKINYFLMANENGSLFSNNWMDLLCDIDYIRKATQEEVLKYFPNELEVPTHGGNDAACVQKIIDLQP